MKLDAVVEAVLGFVANYELTKWELFGFLVLLFVFIRLPAILKHRREMALIRNEFSLESTKLDAKVKSEIAKRERKVLKGKEK